VSEPSTASTNPPLLEMRNIWKSFPGVIASKSVNLTLRSGEVQALLGENGAGKTTLMTILAGLYKADKGEIFIHGEPVDIRNPQEAIRHGIGMVHQHFRLVDDLSVAENIHLGWEETPRIVSREQLSRRIEPMMEEMGFECDANAKIEDLSVGEQQRVEIMKVLSRGARILILDEPTAVLTPQEATDLLGRLRKMAENGRSIVFISHKLDEVLEVSDKITVLRQGRNIGSLPRQICDARSLARLMVGEHVQDRIFEKKGALGKTVLELQNVSVTDDRGLKALKNVDLVIREGELLGIAGVAGNGQSELAGVITGLQKIEEGKLLIHDEDWTGKSAADLADGGVGHIPEDRNKMGLFPSLPVLHNAILREYRKPPIRKGMQLMKKPAVALALQLVAKGDVRVPNIGVLSRVLSGGNQQKLLTQREIAIAERVLVAMHPTRGLDVAATEAVQRALIEHRNNGVAVLLISEDLDEIISVADRIAVMYEGEIVGVVEARHADREKIGLLMGGIKAGMENSL
jgi:general nucleoside transport system ATP-binding protein